MSNFFIAKDQRDRFVLAQTVNTNFLNAQHITGTISGGPNGVIINASHLITMTASTLIVNSTDTCINASGEFKVISEVINMNADLITMTASTTLFAFTDVLLETSDIIINSSHLFINSSDVIITARNELRGIVNDVSGNIAIAEDTASGTLSFVGAVMASLTIPYALKKIDDHIDMRLTAAAGAADSADTLTSTTAIPTKYRPTIDHTDLIRVVDNSVTVQGVIQVNTSGFIIISNGITGGNFTNTGNAGITDNPTLSWLK